MALPINVALAQGIDGNFYGTTFSEVFQMTPDGTLTALHMFTPTTNSSSLVQATDGNFYGTTSSDGAFGSGTVFRFSPPPAATRLLSPRGAINANAPIYTWNSVSAATSVPCGGQQLVRCAADPGAV